MGKSEMSLRIYDYNFNVKVRWYNKQRRLGTFPFEEKYFREMVGDKKEVSILDVGSGPFVTAGNFWDGVKVKMRGCDIMWEEYKKLWEKRGMTPLVPIEYQDMESMTYGDGSFDIVYCANTLDHTYGWKDAVKEMVRVSREWVYLRHYKNQRSAHHGDHLWDVDIKDGKCVFSNRKESDYLDPSFITEKEGDWVISRLHKIYA